jgi:hypothetical protein
MPVTLRLTTWQCWIINKHNPQINLIVTPRPALQVQIRSVWQLTACKPGPSETLTWKDQFPTDETSNKFAKLSNDLSIPAQLDRLFWYLSWLLRMLPVSHPPSIFSRGIPQPWRHQTKVASVSRKAIGRGNAPFCLPNSVQFPNPLTYLSVSLIL